MKIKFKTIKEFFEWVLTFEQNPGSDINDVSSVFFQFSKDFLDITYADSVEDVKTDAIRELTKAVKELKE